MGNVLSGIRDLCRQHLQDEISSETGAETYKQDELDIHIADCLDELSYYSPVESKETLTADGTIDVDISAIDNLINVDYVEYPTGNEPKTFHNCSIFNDTLTIDIASAPTSGDEIYAYCRKLHTLTETSTDLSEREERLLVLGASGKAAMSKSLDYIGRVNIGGANVQYTVYNWGARNYEQFQKGLQRMKKTRVFVSYAR